jgi:hypothetical protein
MGTMRSIELIASGTLGANFNWVMLDVSTSSRIENCLTRAVPMGTISSDLHLAITFPLAVDATTVSLVVKAELS